MSPSTHFRFLDLPAELRLCIYEAALVHDKHIEILFFSRKPGHHGYWKAPALLQSSHLIRKEAAPVYYGQNTFLWRYPFEPRKCQIGWFEPVPRNTNLITWLRLLGATQRMMLRKLLAVEAGDVQAILECAYRCFERFGAEIADGILHVDVASPRADIPEGVVGQWRQIGTTAGSRCQGLDTIRTLFDGLSNPVVNRICSP